MPFLRGRCGLMLIFTAGDSEILSARQAPWGEMTSQIAPLIVAHSLAMSSWVILFSGAKHPNTDRYREFIWYDCRVGRLAPLIVVLGRLRGLICSLPARNLWAFRGPRSFLATMLIEMVSFGTLVAVGLAYRHRSEIHRPMMLTGHDSDPIRRTCRFPYMEDLAFRSPLYVWGPVLLVGGLLFLLQWAMSRAANRWYLMGYAGRDRIFLSVVVATAGSEPDAQNFRAVKTC